MAIAAPLRNSFATAAAPPGMELGTKSEIRTGPLPITSPAGLGVSARSTFEAAFGSGKPLLMSPPDELQAASTKTETGMKNFMTLFNVNKLCFPELMPKPIYFKIRLFDKLTL